MSNFNINKKMKDCIITFAIIAVFTGCFHKSSKIYADEKAPFHAQGEKAGDATENSVILMTRLTAVEKGIINRDVPGMSGEACFKISENENFKSSIKTPLRKATEENDYNIKEYVKGLKSGTHYYYRVIINGKKQENICRFKTAYAKDELKDVAFTVMSGQGYPGRDSDKGHNAYLSMEKIGLDFITLTGDTVYYDNYGSNLSGLPYLTVNGEIIDTTKKANRKKLKAISWSKLNAQHWHAMYALPIQKKFFSNHTGYWEVDDHDYKTNDCGGYFEPGAKLYRQQNPVPNDKLYRTIRWGKMVQLWFLEGREYRYKPRKKDNEKKKAIYLGEEQLNWVKKSMKASDSVFKIIVSPTPVIGASEGRPKGDNISSPPFLDERKNLLDFIKVNVTNFYVVCGDRHWKYVSKSKEYGFYEFCSGALSDKHSRRGSKDKDPLNLVDIVYTDKVKSGGFVRVAISAKNKTIQFQSVDSKGNVLFEKSFKSIK